MSYSNQKRYRLTVEEHSTVLLTVIGNDDRIHATNENGPINVSLPRGVYAIRAELNGQYVDTMVRHTEHQHINPESPKRFTAAPLPDALTSHEYYTYEAWEKSYQASTDQIAWNGDPSSSCLLFLRAPDRKKTTSINQAETLILRTLNGDVLTDFSDASIDRDYGYTAWSAKLSPGLLVLEDHGQQPRQLPVLLLKGFQTQIYVMYRGRPLFDDLRVFTTPYDDIGSRNNRDPYDRNDEFIRESAYVDAGLAALANDVGNIGGKLVRKFLNSKFHNPMLGVIGAYLMLLRRRSGISRSHNPDLPGIVIGNLERLMPGSADIEALKILAEPWIGHTELQPVHGVPLLRIGAETLIQRAADNPALIPEGSILDTVSDRLLGDTVWTSWKPIELPVNLVRTLTKKEQSKDMNWVELEIANVIDEAVTNLDTPKLAKRIGVTQRAVREAYENLVMRTDQHPEDIILAGYDVNRMRRGILNSVNESLIKTIQPVLLDRLAKKATLTYQAVYPKLKTAIAEMSSDNKQVRASDQLDNIVDDKPQLSKIFKRLEKSLLVRLDDIADKAAEFETVRDIASMLVNKTKL